MFDGIPVIAMEEHYWDREVFERIGGNEGSRSSELMRRLYDLSELRLAEMDEVGVDVQVLSLGAPGAQALSADIAVDIAARANDRLAEVIARRPTRFAGLACLPTAVPEAATHELERCVRDLGLCGAMIHGRTGGIFHDDRRFRPIFAAAEELGVPIYLHPAWPDPIVSATYYDAYAADFPQVVRAAWGYTVEAGTAAIRLILSGLFEEHPRLQLVLGHFGETLPYQLWRIDQALRRPGSKALDFRGTFVRNVHVTTSGHFSTTALIACGLEIGLDRVMFAVDYPFVANRPAMDWLATLQMNRADLSKVLSGNARSLLRLS